MLRPAPLGLALLLALMPGRAGAEETPSPGALGFVAGASLFVVGLGAGAFAVASSQADASVNAGWLGMHATLAAAPLFGHGVAAEWGRGLLFSAAPAASLAGTAALFGVDPGAIRHGDREEQRFTWGLFTFGVLASAVGVVDTSFADDRRSAVALVPRVGPGLAALELRGAL